MTLSVFIYNNLYFSSCSQKYLSGRSDFCLIIKDGNADQYYQDFTTVNLDKIWSSILIYVSVIVRELFLSNI